MTEVLNILTRIELRLARLEEQLGKEQSTFTREWYTVAESADLLGKARFTVREWARLGRINAVKRESGRGQASEWMIAHDEIERFLNEGLLPIRR